MAKSNLRAVILTAISAEFSAVREFLSDNQVVHHPAGNIYEHGTFEANNRVWDVGIAEVGVGDANAAIETERAISFFDPQVILFVGIAGGIKDVDIGDVVAATKVYGYESGKADKAFEPRPELGLSTYALIQQAKAEARSREQAWSKRIPNLPSSIPKVRVGAIAAGEKVVASTKSQVYKFLRKNYGDALAVEMEGYGFLKAAHANGQRASAIVIRGISDLIDHKDDEINQEPENVRQEKAAINASAFAFQLLANFQPINSLLAPGKAQRRVIPKFWDDLLQCFHDADVPIVRHLLEEALPPLQRKLYPELSRLATVQALRAVVETIDNPDLAVEWVGSVINAFENPLEGEKARTVEPNLQDWFNKHKPPQVEKLSAKKSSGYLLIALDPKDDDDNVAFTAELHMSNGDIRTDLLPPNTKCSLKEPYEDLFKYLSEAVRQARQITTIEFFLSWRHFGIPIHTWEVSTGLGKPKQLKGFRNTLVRSLDRLTQRDYADEFLKILEEQLECLKKCCDEELIRLCYKVDDLDCETLENELPKGTNYVSLKLLSTLPKEPEDLEQLISIVIWSGIPIWFWTYNTPLDVSQVSNAIDKLLNAENLKNSATFAEFIRKERKNLPDIGLLCDCPTRLPVLVNWKNGRLQQPLTKSFVPA